MITALLLADGTMPEPEWEIAHWVWWALLAMVLAMFFSMVALSVVVSVKAHRRSHPDSPD